MSEKDAEKLVGSEIKAVVPLVFFACGWSCRDQPRTGYWESPRGIRTVGDSRYGVPYGPDRWILLYLAAMGATYGQVFRGSLRQIIEMFELPWSHPVTMARLQRVLACWMESTIQGVELAQRHGIAERFRLLDDGTFEVVLTAAFMAELEQAAPYSFEHARQMGRSYATLDLYLWQMWALYRGHREIEEPQRYLWLARTSYKRYQQLRERCDRIREIWPECPFYWCTIRQVLALRQRRRAMRRVSAQSAQSPRNGAQPEDIRRTTAKRTAALTPSGRPQGMVPVPPSQRARTRRPGQDAVTVPEQRMDAFLARFEQLAAKLDQEPPNRVAREPDRHAFAPMRPPAAQPPKTVPRPIDRKAPPGNRNRDASADLLQSVRTRLELYKKANAGKRRDDTELGTASSSAASTPPITSRTAEELIRTVAVAIGPPGRQEPTDPYSQLIRTLKDNQALQSLMAQATAALMSLPRQTADPPTPSDPARSQDGLPRSEPTPAEQPAQVTASSPWMDFSSWMDVDTANTLSQLIEGAKLLYKTMLSYWPQQPADPSQPDDSAQPPSDGSPDSPE